jgi:endonuclease/exonuclease/phosphatase family metal-dependent hydrolase
MRPHSRLQVALVVAGVLALSACRTVLSAGEWAASPALQVAGADESENCDEQPHRVAPLAGGRKLRIGSWNMLYLGPSEKTPQEKRDPRALAEYVRLSGASVLALQEIGVQSDGADPRSSTLDALFDDLRSRGGGDWTYVLYGDVEKDANQFVGLAWDRRVVRMVEKPVPLEVEERLPPSVIPFVPAPFGSDVPMRRPFAVKLATAEGTDLVFVPVHLAARVETWFFEDATAHREVEAEIIAEALGRLVGRLHDRDVVVLGDFNVERATEEVSDALLERGWRDLNCAGIETYKWGLPLDRMFVPNDQPEFGVSPNFWRVVPPDVASWKEFEERYSDHLMVVADVLVGADDD